MLVHCLKDLSGDIDILEYDNVILVNRVDDKHWNLFVIFPKEKRVESVDLLEPTDVSIKLFQEIWNQIWMYYGIMGYPLESDE